MALVDQLRLMVITDPVLLKGRDPVVVCRAAVQGGATMIQVRWKDGAPAEILELTRALVAALPVPILVNDRADVALAAGAAGAHLGWDDPPLEALRPHVPAGFVLGVSVGNADEATHAAAASADYWSIGPCFATPTKLDAGSPLGPDGFAELARLGPDGVPVIGIGGITATNAASIMQAGAAGVAVIGAVFGADDPGQGARALRAAMSNPLPLRG
jgi:thiamine-phosphate pyrophosphorylase